MMRSQLSDRFYSETNNEGRSPSDPAEIWQSTVSLIKYTLQCRHIIERRLPGGGAAAFIQYNLGEHLGIIALEGYDEKKHIIEGIVPYVVRNGYALAIMSDTDSVLTIELLPEALAPRVSLFTMATPYLYYRSPLQNEGVKGRYGTAGSILRADIALVEGFFDEPISTMILEYGIPSLATACYDATTGRSFMAPHGAQVFISPLTDDVWIHILHDDQHYSVRASYVNWFNDVYPQCRFGKWLYLPMIGLGHYTIITSDDARILVVQDVTMPGIAHGSTSYGWNVETLLRYACKSDAFAFTSTRSLYRLVIRWHGGGAPQHIDINHDLFSYTMDQMRYIHPLLCGMNKSGTDFAVITFHIPDQPPFARDANGNIVSEFDSTLDTEGMPIIVHYEWPDCPPGAMIELFIEMT